MARAVHYFYFFLIIAISLILFFDRNLYNFEIKKNLFQSCTFLVYQSLCCLLISCMMLPFLQNTILIWLICLLYISFLHWYVITKKNIWHNKKVRAIVFLFVPLDIICPILGAIPITCLLSFSSREKINCPNCGNKSNKIFNFCPQCGYKMNIVESKEGEYEM